MSRIHIVCVIIVIVIVKNYQTVIADCSLNLTNNIVKKFDPLFTRNDFLWTPYGNSLEWGNQEFTDISCPGKNNFIQIVRTTKYKNISITCFRDQMFILPDRTLVNAKELQCKNSVSAFIQIENVQCSSYAIGYPKFTIGFYTKEKFIPYIDVCYNNWTGVPLYTQHKLPGYTIKYKMTSVQKSSFNEELSSPHIDIKKAYEKESQKKILIKILGKEKAMEYYNSEQYFFARGHLTPNADGIYNSWQFATYFYVNVAPQWQIINQGNWKRIEDAVRNYAASRNYLINVITGVHDILYLSDKNGTMKKISLAPDDGLLVPKWFWKIIQIDNEYGIVFLTLNNPFEKYANFVPFCGNICGEYGWGHISYFDGTKGFTICCSIHNFMLFANYLPSVFYRSKIISMI